MRQVRATVIFFCLLSLTAAARWQGASPAEIKEAERDVPRVAEVLQLKPGMTVADVGAGFGAMASVMAKWLGPAGRVYATDIAAAQLAALRKVAAEEVGHNIIVLEGAARSTNLPASCCDGIYIRDVYHHFIDPAAIDASLLAALKPGGRLAIIDFPPDPGSKMPEGVPANRGGHGVPSAIVIEEVTKAGFTYLRTIDYGRYFLVLFSRP